jgi:hypothetical protein
MLEKKYISNFGIKYNKNSIGNKNKRALQTFRYSFVV